MSRSYKKTPICAVLLLSRQAIGAIHHPNAAKLCG